MEKVYIAGKVSGLPFEDVIKKFAAAQTVLEAEGHQVVNPVAHLIEYNKMLRHCGSAALTEERDRKRILRIGLGLLATCTAIYLLPDWINSEGAVLEWHFARVFGIKRIELK